MARGGGGKQPEPAHRARARDGAARPRRPGRGARLCAARTGATGRRHQLSHPDRHGRKVHHGAGPQAPARRPSRRAPWRTPGPRHAAARRPSRWRARPHGGLLAAPALWLCVDAGHHGRGGRPGRVPGHPAADAAARSPAAQREEVWRRRPVGARARHRAGRSGRPGPAVQRVGRADRNAGEVTQVPAGQCLARTAFAAHPHPHGAGADGGADALAHLPC